MDRLRERLSQAKNEVEFEAIAREAQLNRWHQHAKFCSLCGGGLEQHPEEVIARQCIQCQHIHYPAISPCIIVLITRGTQCLLAHASKYPAGRYSTLAGFIEPGESAEQAVQREVKEEVGIDVCNIRYINSQAWPFPHSLMLGYFADYASGEIKPDGVEILDARWFEYHQLPDLPPEYSISRQLIRRFCNQHETIV